MNVQYKAIKNNHRSTLIPWTLYTDSFHKNTIIPKEVPNDVIYLIQSSIFDCFQESKKNNYTGIKTHLNNINVIIGKFVPLPPLEQILDSGIIDMCMDFLKRDTYEEIYMSIGIFLNCLAQSSHEYLERIASFDIKKYLEFYLKKPLNFYYLHLNYHLLGISNIILNEKSNISLIFKDFNMSLIPPFLDLINSKFCDFTEEEDSEDFDRIYQAHKEIVRNLKKANYQTFTFIELMTEHPLDHNVFRICFECVFNRIKYDFLIQKNSQILSNLIFYLQMEENDENPELKQEKHNMLTDPLIINFIHDNFFNQYKNFFVYFIHFLFKFNEDINFLSISINDIINFYYQMNNGEIPNLTLTNYDNNLFIYTINNLLIYDSQLSQDQDLINFTKFIFHEKINDFDFPAKKCALRFFSIYISINSNVFFTEIVNYSDFLEFFDDFVFTLDLDIDNDEFNFNELNDIFLIKSIITCLNEIHRYFTISFPFELEKLADSNCTRTIQQLIFKFGSSLAVKFNGVSIEDDLMEFMKLFPLQVE